MRPLKLIPDTLETKAVEVTASILKAKDSTNFDKLVAAGIIIFRAYLNNWKER